MASPRPTGTTARWMSKQRLRWSFGWFESSGDATMMRRELGVAAVAMASPSARLGYTVKKRKREMGVG